MEPERESASPAERAFAEHLESRESGGKGFDDFCAARPALAEELRRIHAAWEWADDLLEPDSPSEGAPRRGAAADEVPRPAVGERYVPGEEVARGGMGVVLRAYDRTLRRTVAMKVLRPGAAGARATLRFLEEAQITGQLEHPSIVPIHDAGETADGRIFYTMPLVRGRDLSRLFRLAREGREGWSTTRVLGVLLRVCEAVGAAHARGVVHRDLKPSNVMVGVHEEVYVMDWGLARIVAAPDGPGAADAVRSSRRERIDGTPGSPLRTLDGQVVGTPSYMSPEQARGEAVGPAADVYSAGAMLRELLVGERPYAEGGDDPDSVAVLERLMAGPPPPLVKVAPGATPALAAICERAMRRDPSGRYAAMSQLAADLRAFLEGRVVSAHRTGAWSELVHWVKRNPALSAAAGIGFASLALGLVASVASKLEADDQAERANAHFSSAVTAVDRMLAEVGADDLDQVPGFQPVRRRLLEDAARFYEDLLGEGGSEPAVRARIARAHVRLATVHDLLGDRTAAVRSQESGLAVLEELAAEEPTFDARVQVARELVALADLHRRSVDLAACRAASEDALARTEQLLRENPLDADALEVRADAFGTLGGALVDERDPAAADWLRRAMEAGEASVESLQEGDPDRARRMDALARSLSLYGALLVRSNRPGEARPHLERSVELREACVASHPSRGTRYSLLSSLGNLNAALGSLEPGSAELEPLSERMVEIARGLRRDYPSVPWYAAGLARSLTVLALARASRGDGNGATSLLDEAVEECYRMHALFGSDVQPGKYLEEVHYSLGWALASRAEHRELARRIEALRPIDETGVADLRVAAQGYAYCLIGLASDEALADAERASLEERYLGELTHRLRALEERSAAGSPLDDPAFGRLRHLPELATFTPAPPDGER